MAAPFAGGAVMWDSTLGKVYLAPGATDMRRSINGLSLMVAETLELDPVSTHWFVFCSRGADKLKILHWNNNGFWLHYRRLEEGRFRWPRDAGDAKALEITARELRWLLDGLNWQTTIAHRPTSAREVR
jgi:transposase